MRLAAFLLHRLLLAVVVLVGVSLVVYLCLFLTGDPAALMLPPDASREEILQFRRAMGFDDPWLVQYLRWIGRIVLHGDFGTSLRFERPVGPLILERLPATALLAVAALAWSTLVGFVLGVVAAIRRGGVVDFLVRAVALSGQAVPVFWLGLLLILFVSLRLRLLPTGGYGEVRHLILPAISLGAYYMSAVTRLVRASLIEALDQDYVRTARRNALIPVVTVQAMYFASLLGGALVTEIVFSWPGIGRLAVQAIQNRDFPLAQSIVLLAATVFVLTNLLVDILYVVLNPRIRL
jgi:peptide/nickel transport system permease protein